MISTGRFREILNDPEKTGEEDVRGLELLLEKYPWFTAPRILLAHYHQREGLYSFSRLLKQAAIYVGDRKQLYKRLQGASDFEKPSTEMNPEPGLLKEEALLNTGLNAQVENLSEITDKAVHPNKEWAEKLAETESISVRVGTSSSKGESDELHSINESVKDMEEEKSATPLYDPLIALRSLIRDEPGEMDSEIPETHQTLHFSPIYDPEKELLKYLEEETPTLPETKNNGDEHDFLFWLDHTAPESSDTETQAERVRNKLKSEAPESTDLLEQFIKNRPQMKRPKTEFFKAETAAKKSESQESPIVSESLAKLLVKQGHFEQAIEVYRKLSLQIPHRKSFFAARITEIEELRNK